MLIYAKNKCIYWFDTMYMHFPGCLIIKIFFTVQNYRIKLCEIQIIIYFSTSFHQNVFGDLK